MIIKRRMIIWKRGDFRPLCDAAVKAGLQDLADDLSRAQGTSTWAHYQAKALCLPTLQGVLDAQVVEVAWHFLHRQATVGDLRAAVKAAKEKVFRCTLDATHDAYLTDGNGYDVAEKSGICACCGNPVR